ncbi:hypothetical protein OESDEN_07673 [Oesophagostomum dentatum]|uniref:Uncharacterized protein n=1 Tax=Oesophagostomum dentatum TaxID=61180 RepID=A0A0B1T4C6_OESDE|nr:hypothetical protein OESDEN_07673 [Oesophagostomum dentatum]
MLNLSKISKFCNGYTTFVSDRDYMSTPMLQRMWTANLMMIPTMTWMERKRVPTLYTSLNALYIFVLELICMNW